MTSRDQLAEYYQAALQWARERGYQGDRLPAGWTGDNCTCPLANAVGGEIALPDDQSASLTWYRSATERAIGSEQLPVLVEAFVRHFDGEDYAGVEGYEDLDPSYDAAREAKAAIEERS